MPNDDVEGANNRNILIFIFYSHAGTLDDVPDDVLHHIQSFLPYACPPPMSARERSILDFREGATARLVKLRRSCYVW